MKCLILLGVAALAMVCMWAIMIVVVDAANSADFDGDWLLEDLTCEELVSGYGFNINTLQDLVKHYNGCITFYNGEDTSYYGDLHCALIKKEGQWLERLINDMVAVYKTKCQHIESTVELYEIIDEDGTRKNPEYKIDF